MGPRYTRAQTSDLGMRAHTGAHGKFLKGDIDESKVLGDDGLRPLAEGRRGSSNWSSATDR